MDHFFKILKRKYNGIPLIGRKLLLPAVCTYHFVRKMYLMLRPCVWLIQSHADDNNDPVGVMFCGNFQEKNYVVRMAFKDDCSQIEIGRVWIWRIKRLIKKHQKDVDLLMYDVPHNVSLWLGNRRCCCIPAWVHGELDFSLIDFNSNTIKADISRICNKYAYTFEVTRGRDATDRFYNEMYSPYLLKRFGKELLLVDFEVVLREFQDMDMEILFVKKGEMFISGGCYCYNKDGSVMFRYLGVNAGDENLVKAGAIQAIYYFLFNHLKNKKHKIISVGITRPFLDDGVLTYKKKWGLRLTYCQSNTIRLYPLHDKPAVRSFLVNNPFIALDRKDLVGVVFVDQEGKLTNEEIKNRYLCHGLKRVIIYCFGDRQPVVCGATEASDVVVRSVKELFV